MKNSPGHLRHHPDDMMRAGPQGDDIKDMVIAGCRVHLAFKSADSGWRVEGTVQCGLEEASGLYRFQTAMYPTREAAEQQALSQVSSHLGNNVDRSTARIRNQGETTDTQT